MFSAEAPRNEPTVAPALLSGATEVRLFDWIAIAACIFVLTGPLFALLIMGADGVLDDAERSRLRLMQMPVYLATLVFLSRRPAQVLLVAIRNVALVALLLLPLLSVAWSISGSLTLRREIALVMTMLLALLIATRFDVRQQMILLGGVLSFCTVLSLFAAVAAPGLAFAPGESALRGIFVHKNVFGWFASLTVVFAVAMLSDRSHRMRRLGAAMVVLGLLGTILSESATSLLAAIIAIAASVVLRMIARQRGPARLVLALLTIQVVAVALFLLVSNFESLLQALGKDPTLTGRVQLWQEVDRHIQERPILGYGFGAFWSKANLSAWQVWETIGWEAPHAHNGYRDLLLDMGLVGFFLFFYVIAKAIWQSVRLLTVEPDGGWIWCPVVIVYCLFLNLSESNFLTQNDMIWLCVAIAVLTVTNHCKALDAKMSQHRRIAVAVI